MEQDRWVEESGKGRGKHLKAIISVVVLVIAIVGVSFLSCGKTKVKRLSFDKGLSTLKVDQMDRLYLTVEPSDVQPELLWKSTDESVVTVIDGIVTSHKAGEAVISATVKDQADVCAECKYIVEDVDVDIQTLDILEEPIVLRPGGHQQMKVSTIPENPNEEILWSSSDESVVRVNARGKVEAIKIGAAYIYAESARTGVRDTALVSVEGPGMMPGMSAAQAGGANASQTAPAAYPAASRTPQVPPSATKASPTRVPAARPSASKSVPVVKPVQRQSSVPVAKSAPTKTASVQTSKPAIRTSAKTSASGTKNLGYANFRGSWPNDVNGRMEFTKTHVIDSKDSKHRMASPGDYVIGEWSDGHLVQGIWYGSDNQVKGSILIGK